MLVLASGSPRRRELLAAAGLDFVVRSAPVAEVREPGESPRDYVLRLSRAKAEAVPRSPAEIVLGADTIVLAGDEVLEKPADAADAARMLRLLSGREHLCLTGICLLAGAAVIQDVAETRVRFYDLAAHEIADYVASGEPMDKAGAYAIQGLASKFVAGITGSHPNVVGLPIALVCQHLKALNARKATSAAPAAPQSPA